MAGKSDLIRLRREFVSMLFALATSQIAILAFAVFMAAPASDSACGPWGCFLAALFHLSLALLVIATSWIGWSRSSAAEKGVDGVFDLDFPAWIVDVLLVILYFFLVCSVEVRGGLESRNFQLEAPSAAPETKWVLWLMVLYGLWDVLTKWFPAKEDKAKLDTASRWPKHAFSCIFASLVTITIIVPVWLFVTKYVQPRAQQRDDVWCILLIDVVLMAVVILFRVLKSAEIAWFHQQLKWRWVPKPPAPDPVTGVIPPSTPPTPERWWVLKAILLMAVIVAGCVICHCLVAKTGTPPT